MDREDRGRAETEHGGGELVDDVVVVDDVGSEVIHATAQEPAGSRIPEVEDATPTDLEAIGRHHADLVTEVNESIAEAADVDLGTAGGAGGEVVGEQDAHRNRLQHESPMADAALDQGHECDGIGDAELGETHRPVSASVFLGERKRLDDPRKHGEQVPGAP